MHIYNMLIQLNIIWLTSKTGEQHCIPHGTEDFSELCMYRETSWIFFNQCGKSCGFKDQSSRNGGVYPKLSRRFGRFYDCFGLCLLWEMLRSLLWEMLRYCERNFKRKIVMLKKKSMNDFELLERLSENWKLKKTRTFIEHRRANSTCPQFTHKSLCWHSLSLLTLLSAKSLVSQRVMGKVREKQY